MSGATMSGPASAGSSAGRSTRSPRRTWRTPARDALATWHLFWEFNGRIRDVLRGSRGVWGFVNDDWLKDVIAPLRPADAPHPAQGQHPDGRPAVQRDRDRRDAVARRSSGRSGPSATECRERLRRRGYLAGEPGQRQGAAVDPGAVPARTPGVELKRTASGERFSTAEEDLAELAGEDEFFGDYTRYRAAEKLEATYLNKMGRPRHPPRFGYLLETGRTTAGAASTCRTCPGSRTSRRRPGRSAAASCRARARSSSTATIRQIELVVLAHALQHQFGYPPQLAGVINGGQDVHKLIAAAVLGKPAPR